MNLNEEILEKIEKAQSLAREKFEGKLRTNITLWDDGDYRIEVMHGDERTSHKIFYRSSRSPIHPGREFLYIVEEQTELPEWTMLEMEKIDGD